LPRILSKKRGKRHKKNKIKLPRKKKEARCVLGGEKPEGGVKGPRVALRSRGGIDRKKDKKAKREWGKKKKNSRARLRTKGRGATSPCVRERGRKGKRKKQKSQWVWGGHNR